VKTAGALVVLVAAGFAAATALADVPLPPVPTISSPITVPSVSTPTLPLPTSTTTPTLPTVTAPTLTPTTAPQPPAPVVSTTQQPAAPTATSTGAGSRAAPAAASPSTSNQRQAGTVRTAQPWISTTGPKRKRTITFRFALQRRERVILSVTQLAPRCRAVGHFSVAGHPGTNRIRFAGRLHGRRLPNGTYRISLRTASGRLLREVTLVIVPGSRPAAAQNACAASAARSSATVVSQFASVRQPPLGQPNVQSAGVATPSNPKVNSGVLATTAEKAADAIQRPYLIVLLGLAIVLLGAASLPEAAVPDPRLGHLLRRHRLELAGLGGAVLAGVTISLLL
jgi:hypothetical protein